MIDQELNRLAAERIMGWEFFDLGYFGTDDETPQMRELESWMGHVGLESVGSYYIQRQSKFWMRSGNWMPTDDIAQAWQLVNMLRGQGWNFELSDNHLDGKPWHAVFWRAARHGSYDSPHGMGDTTASRAIVAAALKVAETQVTYDR